MNYGIRYTANVFGLNVYYSGYGTKPVTVICNCADLTGYSNFIWFISGHNKVVVGSTSCITFPIYGGTAGAQTGYATLYLLNQGNYKAGDLVVCITAAQWHNFGSLVLNWTNN